MPASSRRPAAISPISATTICGPPTISKSWPSSSASGIDFAVSGCICHPPPGVRGWLVLGIFDAGDQQAKFEHLFPPSSFAHSRHAIQAIGGWRDARAIRASVDADLLLRAARAGLTFASTGKVTVHKFVAANRYLSDVRPASDEQVEMLERMQQPGFDETVAAIVEASKRAGTYMSLRHPPYENFAEGEIARRPRIRQGLDAGRAAAADRLRADQAEQRTARPGLEALRAGRNPPSLVQSQPAPENPDPLHEPVSGPSAHLQVAHQNPEVLKALGIEVNGEAVRLRIEHLHHNGTLWEATATMTVALSETDYSIAVIILPDAALPGGEMPGIAVAELALDPLPAGAEPPVACEDGEALQVAVSREKALIEHLLAERAAERGQLETEREAVRAERARVEAERLAERAWVQSERTAELGRIEAELAELGRRMAALKASFSWRLTAPFREIRRLARKVTKEVRRTHQKLLRRVR